MKQLILLSLCCFYCTYLHAQTEKEFGRYRPEELFMKQFPDDTIAEAVILFDEGKANFVNTNESGFNIIYERTTRIKILSEAGLKWAEFEIPFYQNGNTFEIIYDVEGFTHNMTDNMYHKTPLNAEQKYEEQINPYWKLRKIVMPDVKAGSVIELRYKLSSPRLFNLRPWNFQSNIPTVCSQFELQMIPFYVYNYLLEGARKFDENKSFTSTGPEESFHGINFRRLVHQFKMTDLPAFRDESFITCPDDYIVKLNFQLAKVNYPDGRTKEFLSTWPVLIKEYLEDESAGKFIRKCEKSAKSLLGNSISQLTDEKEKFTGIISFIKNNFNYNNRRGIYASEDLKEFIRNKHGNSANINLLLIGLLRSAGLQADPILISTRDHGKVRAAYPYMHFFNNVIACVSINGKKRLADATDAYLADNLLPIACYNELGLVMKEGDVTWLNLQSSTPASQNIYLQTSLNDTSFLTAIRLQATGFFAASLRKHYGNDPEKIRNKLQEEGEPVADSLPQVINYFERNERYQLYYFQQSQPEIINGNIYFSPFLNFPISNNPLKQPTRQYPIDMVNTTVHQYASRIQIPENYRFKFLPENLNIDNDLFSINYTSTLEKNAVLINCSYKFKKIIYPATDYPKLQNFFNTIIKKANEKIVVTSTTE
ncbi:transglutaminase domain-containing protein [Culturomica massiliensis]|uniref:transglutaminase domain-containing protein n=1 Tax=Culturomica massiliensis TaxID=1841857 RepID=UPI0008389189|nr:transglutaminase domain-containing protein [Culturomica massiliensis]